MRQVGIAHKISFPILIYLNYERFTESEMASVSVDAYQTSHNANSISQAPVSFPVSAVNKGIRQLWRMMPGVMQMLHNSYHEILLLAEAVTLLNYK